MCPRCLSSSRSLPRRGLPACPEEPGIPTVTSETVRASSWQFPVGARPGPWLSTSLKTSLSPLCLRPPRPLAWPHQGAGSGLASPGHRLPPPRGWGGGQQRQKAGEQEPTNGLVLQGRGKKGRRGASWDPRVRNPSPPEPLWAVESILQECQDPNGAPVKAVFSRNATRRTMAPLKQKSHCETKMSEWGQGLYSTADRAPWAGRARVTEGQLWPKGHRSFCVTRMGLSGGSLYVSTPVHPSAPGPGPAPTGTQSRPLAADRPG